MKRRSWLCSLAAVGLALALVLGMTACGGSGGSSSSSSGNAADSGDAGDATGSVDDFASGGTATAEREYIIENEVLVDDENLLIRINNVEEDSLWGPQVSLYCENKTDQNIHIMLTQSVINGYTVNALWAEDVAAGMNVSSTIDFYGADADKGLDVIDELQLYLYAFFEEDITSENILAGPYIVYPTGSDAGSVTYPEPVIGDNATVIAENDQARFIIYDTENDELWGYTVLVYMENNTDDTLMFSWDDVSVNGSMCDPFWAMSLAPHTGGYSDITFFEQDFEENNIEAVENITFKLTVGSYLDFMTENIIDDVFTYEP